MKTSFQNSRERNFKIFLPPAHVTEQGLHASCPHLYFFSSDGSRVIGVKYFNSTWAVGSRMRSYKKVNLPRDTSDARDKLHVTDIRTLIFIGIFNGPLEVMFHADVSGK